MIYAGGCSLTHGYDIHGKIEQEPMPDAWPGQLGKLLGHEVVNEAEAGLSNETMFKKLMLYVQNNPKPDLVVLAFTEFSRMTFCDPWGKQQNFRFVENQAEVFFDLSQQFFKYHYEDQFFYDKFLIQVQLWQTWLKHHNINYLFLNAFDFSKLINKPELVKHTDTERWWGFPDRSFTHTFKQYPVTDTRHPTLPAHVDLAKQLEPRARELL